MSERDRALINEHNYLLRLFMRGGSRNSGPDNPSAGVLLRELGLYPGGL
jgi:hypothetical protein